MEVYPLICLKERQLAYEASANPGLPILAAYNTLRQAQPSTASEHGEAQAKDSSKKYFKKL